MGKLIGGIFGGFSGKVGKKIGFIRNGKFYIKAAPSPSKKTPSPLQRIQRQKFALASKFISQIAQLVTIGFYNNLKPEVAPKAAALACFLKTAISHTASGPEIDYTKIIFSKGRLRLPAQITLEIGVGQSLNLTWQDIHRREQSNPNDQLAILVYDAKSGQVFYALNVASRAEEQATLNLPDYFTGTEVYVHIAFYSNKDQEVSNSTYIGLLGIN